LPGDRALPQRSGCRALGDHLLQFYKSAIPVIEQALETSARLLGSDKSRSYCLEMICADFLAVANLENGNPEVLLCSLLRFFRFLPAEHQRRFLKQLRLAA
jgi:hypothetical protein